MEHEERKRLARTGDSSLKAQQARYAAVIAALGMTKTQFGAAIGQSVQAITNSTTGANAPSRKALAYLYEAHRVEPRFILYGDLALHDPLDARVFAELLDAEKSAD